MAGTGLKGFSFYESYWKTIMRLRDEEQRKELAWNIVAFAFSDDDNAERLYESMSYEVSLAFSQIEANIITSKRRSENGKKGMSSRWNNKPITNSYQNDNKPITRLSLSSSLSTSTTCIKKESNKEKKFVKPSIEEVESYCKERQNGIDAQRFIDFYESKGWLIGKNKMKDWKAAVRTWERNRSSDIDTSLLSDIDKWEQENVVVVNG